MEMLRRPRQVQPVHQLQIRRRLRNICHRTMLCRSNRSNYSNTTRYSFKKRLEPPTGYRQYHPVAPPRRRRHPHLRTRHPNHRVHLRWRRRKSNAHRTGHTLSLRGVRRRRTTKNLNDLRRFFLRDYH